jgi:hypothetical protein
MMLRSALTFLFFDRASGRIVVGQWPNLPLWIFIFAWAAGRLIPLPQSGAYWLGIVASLALVVWALDEIVRGVNPWRRLLGAGVLVAILVSRFD